MTLKNALYELLNHLDEVETRHHELQDTAVRELLHAAIMKHFVLALPSDDFPLGGHYAMFTRAGNQALYKVLGQFLNHSEVRAALQLTPQERLDAFQDSEVISSNGSTYDNFFGWRERL